MDDQGLDIRLTREEALEAWANKRVFKVKPSKMRDYPLFFLHDKEGKLHKSSPAVCIYGNTWHRVGHDKEIGEPVLKEPRPEVHEYDESSEEGSEDTDDDAP